MDGFKCYTDVAIVKNIDRNFTAITGMNGSGKSNIIDAIVFTLDLNTSKYMRVSNLKELINVNRKDCCVTIKFDNSEKKSCPGGYESFETIEISRSLDHEGKSKYKLNGHNATKSSIESLCRNIGITNNFVIMQGHITKIINMKSVDLKNMIEETAGTRSYSEEREKSLDLLQKKEFKLREAREHLQKTISPFFEQLKREKRIYEENRDFEANKKVYQKELKSLENLLTKDIYNEKITELSNLCEKYSADMKNLKEIELKVKDSFSNEENSKVNFDIQLNNYKNKLEELKLQNFDEILREKTILRDNKVKSLNIIKLSDIQSLKEREAVLSKELLSGSNFDKLNDLESSRNNLNIKESQFNSSVISISEYLKGILKNRESFTFQNSVDTEILQAFNNILNHLNNLRISNQNSSNFQIEKEITFLKENNSQLLISKNRIVELEDKITSLKSKIIYPVIDGVFGTVDENFDLIDEKYKEAIFTILGGRAKFIICKDEEIASQVLTTSDRKVSCIPLTKIAYSEPSSVPYKCINALKAITFDLKYQKAFKHIFSNFFLFEDNETASKCCFECKVMCVTLDGTVYDPNGTLTCGKSTFKPNVIRYSELKSLESELIRIKENLPSPALSNELPEFIKRYSMIENLENEINRISSRAEMLENLCSTNVNVSKELEKVRTQIVGAVNEEKTRNGLSKEIKILEDEISELKYRRDQTSPQIKEIEMKIGELTNLQTEQHERQMKRKASIKMYEVYDEKRKSLIKSTVHLESRISKLFEEIKELRKNLNLLTELSDSEKPSSRRKGNRAQLPDSENRSNFECCYDNISKINNSLTSEDFDILNEKFFIVPQDFIVTISEKIDRNSVESQIQILKEKINQKRITVSMDPNNFELLEKNIIQVQSLEEKIAKLEKDRQEILKNIEKLNEIGISENLKAFNHINKQIKLFLNYFLPNTDIIISPDFEIKVKIGNWKNSLSELSGGQKSLIALCLMFSMLTFRPAPFYIFDEIDAALDLNYTQAIGEIIKNEFKGAQFIVISLKNNMFDYANRIFKVYIQDHRSKILQLK